MLWVLGFKKIAVSSMHGTPDIDGRHPLAFKPHNPASMGKFWIPCDVVMQAFVAGDGHGADN